MADGHDENFPQGLKPQYLCGFYGTAEAVPFQSGIYAAVPGTGFPRLDTWIPFSIGKTRRRLNG
jgi:hypothetical protein